MPRREKCAKVLLFSSVGICLCWKLFEFRSIVRIVKCRMSWSWPGWFIDGYCIPPLCSRPKHVFDRLFLTKYCRCFSDDTKGADGAAHLLEVLSQSSLLEELDFGACWQIQASAWQKVRNAKWLNLKKANFNQCLAERNGWGFSCFFAACIRKLFEFGSGEICEVVVGVGVDRDRFKMECTWTCPGLVPFPTSFQIDSSNTAGVSTLTRKVQMEPQICFKPWVSRRCWKSWIFNCVITSPQQHGKKSVMPSGSTWRRQISLGAS